MVQNYGVSVLPNTKYSPLTLQGVEDGEEVELGNKEDAEMEEDQAPGGAQQAGEPQHRHPVLPRLPLQLLGPSQDHHHPHQHHRVEEQDEASIQKGGVMRQPAGEPAPGREESLGDKGQQPQEGAGHRRGMAVGTPIHGKMEGGNWQSQAHQNVAPGRAVAGSCSLQPWDSSVCPGTPRVPRLHGVVRVPKVPHVPGLHAVPMFMVCQGCLGSWQPPSLT